jgi:SAM-dependent methyltransferase
MPALSPAPTGVYCASDRVRRIPSFRDPAGRVALIDGRVFRLIDGSLGAPVLDLINSSVFQQLVEEGLVVRTDRLDDATRASLADAAAFSEVQDSSDGNLILEHELVPFQAYPYEWAADMLYAAGRHTLDLAMRLLPHRLGLKDASPFNLVFRAAEPVFVDVLSIERRDPHDQTWLPYAQFLRAFVRPLLVNKHFGIGLAEIFRTHRDGLNPESVFRMCSPIRKLSPTFLSVVSLPHLLSRNKRARNMSIYQRRIASEPEKAQFILKHQLRSLRRKLEAAKPKPARPSDWGHYLKSTVHSEEYHRSKSRFVDQAIARARPLWVLDVGCNVGHLSAIAAKHGANVVAIDSDARVVGEVWRRASAEQLNILPLVIDITRPTPPIGWRNLECVSFLDRARGAFDCVLMLALLHHLLINERIPLGEIIGLAAELTTSLLIIEYIPPSDPMFRSLARGNDQLYQSVTRANFEDVCARYFTVEKAERLADSERWVYQMRRRLD